MKKIIATAIVALTIPTIGAQTKSFEAVVAQMLVTNPTIKELSHGSEAEIQEMKAENVLEGPELEGFHKWGNSGDRKYGFGISQGFDWPGLYGARRQMIHNNEAALGLLRNATVTDKKTEARGLLVDLVNSKRNIVILERIDSMMVDLAKYYDAAYRSGQVSILEKNKIDIEVIRLEGRLTEENNRYGDIIASIFYFCGSDQLESDLLQLDSYPDAMLLPADEYKKLSENDPYMAYLKQVGEVNKSKGKIASRSALPSFSLGYEWEREEGQDFNGINIGVKFATWSNKNNRASIIAAGLENDVKIAAQSKKLITDIDNDHSTALDLIKQIDKFETALNVGTYHELLLKALKGGQINMLDYIQEVNFYLEAELDLENMRHEYQLVLSRLNRLN